MTTIKPLPWAPNWPNEPQSQWALVRDYAAGLEFVPAQPVKSGN